MKIYKYDCIGRVPSSIRDLEKCETCQNEEICMGLWGAPQVTTASTSGKSASRIGRGDHPVTFHDKGN
jgi:hypothetical protein